MMFSDQELEAYLDEALSVARMAEIEAALRCDSAMSERLARINARRDAGEHTLGEIWRVGRASCPPREELGSFLLGVLSDEAADYVAFHANEAGCRYCQASLDDLRSRQGEAVAAGEIESRRRKYFQSSAGYLRREA
jgi:anti-sigma factor RsiW